MLLKILFRHTYSLILLLIITATGFSQSHSESVNENAIPAVFYELAETSSGTEEFLEVWKYYQEHPLNINEATKEELAAIGILNTRQIQSLVQFRKKYGNYVAVNELKTVPGFSDLLVSSLHNIFKVASPKTGTPLITDLSKGKHWFLFRGKRTLETANGYKGGNPEYAGNPWKLYTRYRYFSGLKYSLGYTLEKDAGEAFFDKSNRPGKWYRPYRGFDFHSAHLYWRPEKLVKCIAIGDYSINTGQGLVLRNGFSFGKSVFSIIPNNHSHTLRPYTSAAESGGLRGAAVQLEKGLFSLTTFYSKRKHDATIKKLHGKKVIHSLPASGLHRTQTEILKKQKATITAKGLHGSFNNQWLQTGITLTHTQTSLPMPLKPKNRNFKGNEFINAGFNYSVLSRSFTLSGEIAADKSHALAQIHTLSAFPGNNLDLSLSYRNYSKRYHSFFALPFGETGKAANEEGLYAGWVLRPADHWELRGYMDMYHFSGLRHRTSAPSRGKEHLLQLGFYPEEGLSCYIRWKTEQKQINQSGNTTPYHKLTHQRVHRARFNLKYRVTPQMKAQSRIAFSSWQNDKGCLLFQDLQYSFPDMYITLTGRLAWYTTASYQSAIYAYENDVLYSFSIKPYYLQGTRSFLLFKYHVNSHTDIWIRWASTNKPFASSIGNGYSQTNGPARNEVTLQLMLEF